MLQTSLLSPEALSPTLICCILSFDVCILPEELVCHKNSQIHMWSFLKPDQLFPLKSRRNTSVWPLKPLEKQWKGLQYSIHSSRCQRCQMAGLSVPWEASGHSCFCNCVQGRCREFWMLLSVLMHAQAFGLVVCLPHITGRGVVISLRHTTSW